MMTTLEMNANINGKSKKDNGWNEDHHRWIQKLTNQKVQKNQETLIIQNVSNEWWKMDKLWKTSTHALVRAIPPRITNQVFPKKIWTSSEHHYLGPNMLQLVYYTHWKPTGISFVTFV